MHADLLIFFFLFNINKEITQILIKFIIKNNTPMSLTFWNNCEKTLIPYFLISSIKNKDPLTLGGGVFFFIQMT